MTKATTPATEAAPETDKPEEAPVRAAEASTPETDPADSDHDRANSKPPRIPQPRALKRAARRGRGPLSWLLSEDR